MNTLLLNEQGKSIGLPLVVLCLLLGFPLMVRSQVAVVGGSQAISKNAYVAGAGSNRLLIVAVSDESLNAVGAVTDITWGSTALTYVNSRKRGNDIRAEIWILDEAGIIAEGGGPATFTVNWDAGPLDEMFSVVTLENVDQTNPVPATEYARKNSASLQLDNTLSPSLNDIVYYVAATRAVSSHTPTGYTELSDQTSGFTMADAYLNITASGDENPTATFATSASMVMVGIQVKFSPSGTFTAAQDGDWNLGTTWGGGCATGCMEGTDYPDDTYNAAIPAGMDIIIPSGVAAVCYDLSLNSDRGNAVASLTLTDNTASLTTSHDLIMQTANTPSVDDIHVIDMNGGNIAVGNDLTLEADEGAGATIGVVVGSESNSKTAYSAGSGSNRLLVVTVGDESVNAIGTITDITWGGQSLTFQHAEERGNDVRMEVWTLDEAAISSEVGAQNFTVNWSAGPANEKFNVFTLENVNQSTPFGSSNSNNANVMALQLAAPLSLSNGDFMYYAAATRANQSHTPAAGYTEISDQTGGWGLANAYLQSTSSGTEQPTASWAAARNALIIGCTFTAIGGGNTQESQILVDGGTLTISGDINLKAENNVNAAIDLTTVAGSTLDIEGNIIETGTTKTGQLISVNNNSTINYTGAAAQTIRTTIGSTTITTVDILNIGGGSNKTLEGDLTVNSAINFSSGTITLGDAHMVASGAITGHDQNSYFITNGTGYLERSVPAATTVDFPVGLSNTTLLNLVQLTAADNSTFQVRIDDTIDNALNDPDRVLNAEWTITRTGGTGSTTVRLSWRDDGTLTSGPTFDPADVDTKIGRWNGTYWEQTTTSATDAIGPDYYFEATGFTNFSPFVVASGSMLLPIKLIDFKAQADPNSIEIRWTTASELNNDFFTLEKSTDNQEYFVLDRINGAGTTNTIKEYQYTDHHPAPGINYYRLSQTDYDGKQESFPIIAIQYSTAPIKIFPVPLKDKLHLQFDFEPQASGKLIISNIAGKRVLERPIIAGTNKQQIDVIQLKSGAYFIEYMDDQMVWREKFIKE